ncbi:efflux RND transporter periplasmic adaptor subunit [Porticoccus sp.]|uniref:efflux RND transporter periplasmic adaptor subunit n=1 Tax=Porticoccus sp. TaxID=2024853 RepID=UPI000C5783E1|nr:efflux RND transporter periplasmic adaptor subunit [Porticoccus sp.]MAZ69344.1 efflux transporter periplasmic adaptor subunit [Porticoccus sp.]|tara:strand:+ start:3015 stop:4100 length:1086 start_codon:yes stop_codon:yes gene_type:complete
MRFKAIVLALSLYSLSLGIFAAPAAAPVFVKAATTELFSEKIEAIGTLKANEAVTLSATVTETITAIHFDDGQRVGKGDVLVEMTSAEEHAQLEEALSTVKEAERQYRRIKSLVTAKLSTESLLDERQAAFEAAKAKLNATRSRLADRLILAPFDGVLGLRQISVGQLVTPGDSITTLDDDSVMKLDMSVPAIFLSSLRTGMTITAKAPELDNQQVEGEVASIDSRVDPITRAVMVRALLPNEQRKLKPGMLVTVVLQKPPQERLMISEESLIQEGFNQFAFVVDTTTEPARVVKRKLVTGPRRPGAIAVMSGIEVGELVVTHGTMRLNDGTAVHVVAEQRGNESLSELLRQQNSPSDKAD